MKFRFAFLSTGAFCAVAALASPALAIQSPDDISPGERFRKNVPIDTETRLPGGGVLAKSSPADVEIESLGHGKVKATFFQGGQRKGEAEGVVVIPNQAAGPVPKGGGPAGRRAQGAGPGGAGPGALKLSDLGLDANAPARLVKGAGTLDLEIGNPGGSRILIGLLLPAVQPPAIVPPAPAVPPPPAKQGEPADTKVREGRDVQTRK